MFCLPVLRNLFTHVDTIEAPGTLDAGDVMMVGKHFYIGLSQRTNATGAIQLIQHLKKYERIGSTVEMSDMLHLKTGVNSTLKMIQEAGYKTASINVSEFEKLDGGLSCLSLRF